jgi:hypothetical protein
LGGFSPDRNHFEMHNDDKTGKENDMDDDEED